MTDDQLIPIDLNAFLKNSQLLKPAFKEKYSDYLIQLLQKAVAAWDDDPQLAYSYCEEFKHNIPDSVLLEIFQLVDQLESFPESVTLQNYLDIERRTVLKFEQICIHSIKACFYYKQIDIDECANECRTVLNHDTENEYANYLLALCLGLREKHNEAIPYFKKVLNSEDYHHAATANLAYSYLFLGKTFKALRLNKQVVDKLADNYRVQYYMALCYARLWRYKKALYYLNRAEALEKNFSGIYVTRGSIYFKFRQWDKAYNDLFTAKKLGSKKAEEFLMKF